MEGDGGASAHMEGPFREGVRVGGQHLAEYGQSWASRGVNSSGARQVHDPESSTVLDEELSAQVLASCMGFISGVHKCL